MARPRYYDAAGKVKRLNLRCPDRNTALLVSLLVEDPACVLSARSALEGASHETHRALLRERLLPLASFLGLTDLEPAPAPVCEEPRRSRPALTWKVASAEYLRTVTNRGQPEGTVERYAADVARVTRALEGTTGADDLPLGTITPSTFEELAYWLRNRAPVRRSATSGARRLGYSPGTAGQVIRTLVAVLNAVEREHGCPNPWSRVDKATRKRLCAANAPGPNAGKPLSYEELLLLLGVEFHPFLAYCLTMAWGGLRPGEAQGLLRSDVDLRSGRVAVNWKSPQSKAKPGPAHEEGLTWRAAIVGGERHILTEPKQGRRRLVYLPERVLPFLRRLPQPLAAGDAFLFSPTGDGSPCSRGQGDRGFRSLLTAAGITGHTPKDLRHTYSKLLRRVRVQEYVVSRLMGHSTGEAARAAGRPIPSATTAGYGDLDESEFELKEAARLLDALTFDADPGVAQEVQA